MTKVLLASDHAGVRYKTLLLSFLRSKGYDVYDLGGDGSNPEDDYPDYAAIAAAAVQNKEAEKAVLICGSAVGISIAANKFDGIRTAVCHDIYSAHQAVEHDHANVLCMGERVIGIELCKEITLRFLEAKPSQEPRHLRRVSKIKEIEKSKRRHEQTD